MLASDKGVYIERNVPNFYETDATKRFTNYWMAINEGGTTDEPIGVIGYQVELAMYERLIPSPVIEEPYSLSLINLYNKDLEPIWSWNCPDCDDEITRAASTEIEQTEMIRDDQFILWEQKCIAVDTDLENPCDEEWSDDLAIQEKIVKVQNQEVPLSGVTVHEYYDPAYIMYVVVGHSAALSLVMDEKLTLEISRGITLFLIALFASVLILFIAFSWAFERKLQVRVTKPISELSKQIKNPKEFMASRNKSVDMYARKATMMRKASRETTITSSDLDRTTDTSAVVRDTSASEMRRGSSMGRTKLGQALGGTDYRRQREQDEKISKFKTINEVQALRGVFYNFFEMKDVQGKDATNDKVLISMQVAETSLNPFYNFGDEDEEADNVGLDTSSRMFAYSSNLSGMFEHLQKLNVCFRKTNAMHMAQKRRGLDAIRL